MPRWLFVAYGGGHIRMVLPVMQRVRALGIAEPIVLALTTAQTVARDAGFEPLGFADFVGSADASALAKGRKLVDGLGTPPVDLRESVAYMGLSFADLEAELGVDRAAQQFALSGRQGFRPVRTLERIIGRLNPDLVIATNSPRAERAAIDAARRLKLPTACLVDLFALDEVAWIGQRGFADRVCVLSAGVKGFLVEAGRQPEEIEVTGNPAFDTLRDPKWLIGMVDMRLKLKGHAARKVLLFASSAEPASHPFNPSVVGNVALPLEIGRLLAQWATVNADWRVWIKPHPSQVSTFPDSFAPARVCDPSWALPAMLHAVDAVVVITSTIAVEASLVGKPVIRVLGSLFDRATPFQAMGFADASVDIGDLADALNRLTLTSPRAMQLHGQLDATSAVVRVLQGLTR